MGKKLIVDPLNALVVCPICLKKYYLTEFSNVVCKLHEKWFITTCDECNQICFSDAIKICIPCSNITPNDRGIGHGRGGFSVDRRWLLRKYGLENWMEIS